MLYEDDNVTKPLLIEVKVSSHESDEQVRKYQESLRSEEFDRKVEELLASRGFDASELLGVEGALLLLSAACLAVVFGGIG